MRSPKSMSSIDPRETNMLNPTPASITQSIIVLPRAPLWEMKAIFPGAGMVLTNVVFRPTPGLMNPRQLGPRRRMPYFVLISSIRSSSLRPCSPVSLKPAEMTTMPCTPARPHCSTALGTIAAGVTITVRSGGVGISVTFLKQGIPRTLCRDGLTGKIRLPSARSIFLRTARPTLSSLSVAPTIAPSTGRTCLLGRACAHYLSQ